MDIVYIKSSIQTHITCILEKSKFFICYYSSIMSSLCQHLIPLLDIAPNHQSPIILIQLIKMISDFLSVLQNMSDLKL